MEEDHHRAEYTGRVSTDSSLLNTGSGRKGGDVLVRKITHHKIINLISGPLWNGIHLVGAEDTFDERELLIAHKQIVIEKSSEETGLCLQRFHETIVKGAGIKFVNQYVGGDYSVVDAEVPLIPPRAIAPLSERRCRVVGERVPLCLPLAFTQTASGLRLVRKNA